MCVIFPCWGSVQQSSRYCCPTPSAANCASHMPSLKAQESGESNAATAAVSRGNRLGSSIVHISGQPCQLFESLKINELFCCPANPFLDAWFWLMDRYAPQAISVDIFNYLLFIDIDTFREKTHVLRTYPIWGRAFNMCGDVATPNLYAVAQQNCLQAPDTRTTVMGRRSGGSSSNDDVERAAHMGVGTG